MLAALANPVANLTRAVINTAEIPSGDFVLHRDAGRGCCATCRIDRSDARRVERRHSPRQKRSPRGSWVSGIHKYHHARFGLAPVSCLVLSDGMERVIELNGVAIEEKANRQSRWDGSRQSNSRLAPLHHRMCHFRLCVARSWVRSALRRIVGLSALLLLGSRKSLTRAP